MKTTSITHVPFAQLPVEARFLFFIYSLGAMGHYHSYPPTPSEIGDHLALIWEEEELTASDLSDPHRMRSLLKKHFVCYGRGSRAKSSMNPDIAA